MNKWLKKIKEKVINDQNDIMTFSDNLHRKLFTCENNVLSDQELKAKKVFEHYEHPRFLTYKDRVNDNIQWPDIFDKVYSQGVFTCMQWKGRPLIKSAIDLAVLNMLVWELKPGAIVEIGSGSGISAEYLSDITEIYGLSTKIISFDIKPVLSQYKRVTYLKGDCNNPSTFNPIINFINDKPTLFIEDAHVNVLETLKFLLNFSKSGDYFFIEDSFHKQKELEEILRSPDLLLDRYFLDFFGKNSTSSINGIFKVFRNS